MQDAATKIRIRHDALVEVTVESDGKVLKRDTVYAMYLDAHCTVISLMYNANPYSGGGLWWDPSTGLPIKQPKVRTKYTNLEESTLTGDQLCECDHCLGGHLPPLS